MKNCFKVFALSALGLALIASAGAAEETVTGKWKGEFDSQIGIQKYTFDLRLDGDKITGKATGEREMGTNEVVITEGKLGKDGIFFVEPLKFDENEIRIEYTGKLSGDEIKFHRKVGDFATEDFVAKRVKETDAKPEGKADTKPAAKEEIKPAPAKP